MEKTGFLLCEGDSDVQFLNRVITPLPVRIIPTGGKYGAGSFIKGFLEGKKVSKPDFYFYYRDRDFDFPPPGDEVIFSTLSGGLLISHRITLENYLISPEKIFEFCSLPSSNMARTFSLMEIENLIEQAARTIKFYQAARHALGALRLPINIKTTWVESGSGTLPEQLNEKDCARQALQYISPEREKIDAYSDQKFVEQYHHFIHLFDDRFFEEKKYLIWFQGKDLISAFKVLLPDFPTSSYLKFAMKNCEPKHFPDLIKLKQLIQDNLL